MTPSLLRFHGSYKAGSGYTSSQFAVSLFGHLPSGGIRSITLKLGNSGLLSLGSLSSELRQTLRLLSVEVFNATSVKPLCVYTADTQRAVQTVTQDVPIPNLTVSTASGYAYETQYFVTLEVQTPSPLSDKPLPCFSYTENDVVFIFPDESFEDPYLWASVANLSKVSPYWNSMFKSGYSESTQQLTTTSIWAKSWKSDLSAILKKSREHSRNGGGGDDAWGKENRVTSRSNGIHSYLDPCRSVTQKAAIRYVIVRDTPIRTYQAVFTWLLIGNIDFAKLPSLSSQPPSDTAAVLSSPIAIYCLAHLLEMETLQKLALSNYESQLSAKNALAELFSQPSYTYLELKEAARTAAIKHWAAIKAAGGLATVVKAVDSDEADIEQMLRSKSGFDMEESLQNRLERLEADNRTRDRVV